MADHKWTRALITGASSGIGESFARLLAADGADLILVARRADRLNQLADELDVDVTVLTADLSREDDRQAVCARIESETDPVDLLVANAGISTLAKVATGSWDDARAMIDVNIIGAAQLVYTAARVFEGRGAGGILVTSSTASFQPIANSTTYAATKAFVTYFCEGLHEELRGSGVHVTALCPGPTRTEILDPEKLDRVPSFVMMDAEPVARAGLEGVARNKTLVVPGLTNQVGAVLAGTVPRAVARRVAGSLYGRFTDG